MEHHLLKGFTDIGSNDIGSNDKPVKNATKDKMTKG